MVLHFLKYCFIQAIRVNTVEVKVDKEQRNVLVMDGNYTDS